VFNARQRTLQPPSSLAAQNRIAVRLERHGLAANDSGKAPDLTIRNALSFVQEKTFHHGAFRI
jgi:hypothetical protein